MAYKNQNFMTNRKIKEAVDKNQKDYQENEDPIDENQNTGTENNENNNTGAGEGNTNGDGPDLDDEGPTEFEVTGPSVIIEEDEF